MNTRQEILEKSEALFLKYGIKSITMDDLARQLGISKKTLYQYVTNKADLIQQIVGLYCEEERRSIKQIRDTSANAIEEMLNIAQHVSQHLRKLRPTTVYDLQKYYRKAWSQMESLQHQHVYTVIVENLAWGVREGLYRDGIDFDILGKLYVGKINLMVDEDIFPQKEYNKERLFREFIRYHIHGVASRKGLMLLEKYLNTENGKS